MHIAHNPESDAEIHTQDVAKQPEVHSRMFVRGHDHQGSAFKDSTSRDHMIKAIEAALAAPVTSGLRGYELEARDSEIIIYMRADNFAATSALMEKIKIVGQVDLDFPEAAFAQFPVNVTKEKYPYVIKY